MFAVNVCYRLLRCLFPLISSSDGASPQSAITLFRSMMVTLQRILHSAEAYTQQFDFQRAPVFCWSKVDVL